MTIGSAQRDAARHLRPVPIYQAPIGSACTPELAAAVSNAGGLGALALSWTTPGGAAELVSRTAELTAEPFQVNFVLAFEAIQLEAALEAGALIVTFSWGMPTWHAEMVHSFGRPFGVQVTSVEGAKRSLDCGADFLICQGVEAGGHVQATRPLMDILPSVLEAADSVPVIASGGLATGRSIAHVVQAGARGAMLGTRFVATRESKAHDIYKRAITAAARADAVLTTCFDGGWPYALHRVLRNSTLAEWEGAGCPPDGSRPGEHDIVAVSVDGRSVRRYEDSPPLAGMTGHAEQLSLYAGLGCGEIDDIPRAADAVRRLWQEASELLAAPVDNS